METTEEFQLQEIRTVILHDKVGLEETIVSIKKYMDKLGSSNYQLKNSKFIPPSINSESDESRRELVFFETVSILTNCERAFRCAGFKPVYIQIKKYPE